MGFNSGFKGLTLHSMVQIYTSVTLLTSRVLAWSPGRLMCQHASHVSAVAHISWDFTYVSNALQTLPFVSRNGGNSYRKSEPTDLFIRHQITRLQRSAYESQSMGRDGEGDENKTKFYVSSRDVRLECPRLNPYATNVRYIWSAYSWCF